MGNKLHQTFYRNRSRLENILNGFVLPEPWFSRGMNETVCDMMKALRDPMLPLLELQVLLLFPVYKVAVDLWSNNWELWKLTFCCLRVSNHERFCASGTVVLSWDEWDCVWYDEGSQRSNASIAGATGMTISCGSPMLPLLELQVWQLIVKNNIFLFKRQIHNFRHYALLYGFHTLPNMLKNLLERHVALFVYKSLNFYLSAVLCESHHGQG